MKPASILFEKIIQDGSISNDTFQTRVCIPRAVQFIERFHSTSFRSANWVAWFWSWLTEFITALFLVARVLTRIAGPTECTLSYRRYWTRDSHVTRAIRFIPTPCISRLEAEQSDNRYKNTNRHILLLVKPLCFCFCFARWNIFRVSNFPGLILRLYEQKIHFDWEQEGTPGPLSVVDAC